MFLIRGFENVDEMHSSEAYQSIHIDVVKPGFVSLRLDYAAASGY